MKFTKHTQDKFINFLRQKTTEELCEMRDYTDSLILSSKNDESKQLYCYERYLIDFVLFDRS